MHPAYLCCLKEDSVQRTHAKWNGSIRPIGQKGIQEFRIRIGQYCDNCLNGNKADINDMIKFGFCEIFFAHTIRK